MAKLLPEVCSQVAAELELQKVSPKDFLLSTANTQDGTKFDIVMNRFWDLPLIRRNGIRDLTAKLLPVAFTNAYCKALTHFITFYR